MILAGVTLGSQAGPVVKAMMDTSTLMMGKMGMLQLMVEEPKNACLLYTSPSPRDCS